MMKKLLFLLLLPITLFGQHTLKGNFAVENGYQFAILYRIAPDNVFYVTDSNMNAEGLLELPLSAEVTPGMYRLVYNLPPDQHFFDFLYNGKEDIEFNFSSDKVITYVNSDENKLWLEYRKQLNTFENEIAGLMTGTEVDAKDMKKVLKRKKKWFEEVEETAKGTFAELFISNTQPYITEQFENKSSYNSNAKKAYLKNLDFSNAMIQNSAIPLEQSLKYIFNFVDQEDLTVSRENNIDDISKSVKTASAGYQMNLLENVYNFLVAQEEVAEANYLAGKHLIPLADANNKRELSNRLKLYMSLSIGAKAPNFGWPEYDGDVETINTLHQLEGNENYIVVFWSSLCSHCLKEIPILHNKIKTLEEGKLKVIAVGLEDFEQEWAPKAKLFPEFINVLGLGRWENQIGDLYDVSGTPTYFFLDGEKKIKAKPESLEELFLIIDAIDE